MTEKITHWKQGKERTVKDILALNFCFNVDPRQLFTSDVFSETTKALKDKGYTSTFYGVGNFGFRMIKPDSPVATDGEYEGHWNDPFNDHDFITVTDANFTEFKNAIDTGVNVVRKKYGTPNTNNYFHWAHLTDPKWNSSNFDIPNYCTIQYQRDEETPRNQMELHWLKDQPGWLNELLAKYAPWYSTRIGFPIINISTTGNKLSTEIWQPYATEIDPHKKHEVKIATPWNFGKDPRDILQATRIVFGSLQASIFAKSFAYISNETKSILKNGIANVARSLTDQQKENAKSRYETVKFRARNLEEDVKRDKKVYDDPNQFVKHGGVEKIIDTTLEQIGWFDAVNN